MSSNFPISVVGLPPNCIKPVLDSSQDSSKRKILQGAEPPPENQFGPEGSLAGDRMKGQQRLEPSEPSEHMTKNMEIYGNLWKSMEILGCFPWFFPKINPCDPIFDEPRCFPTEINYRLIHSTLQPVVLQAKSNPSCASPQDIPEMLPTSIQVTLVQPSTPLILST